MRKKIPKTPFRLILQRWKQLWDKRTAGNSGCMPMGMLTKWNTTKALQTTLQSTIGL